MPEIDSIIPRSGSLVYDILVIVSVLSVLIFIRDFVEIFPTANNCLFKWQEATRLEFNLKLRHTRDIVYGVLVLPICLVLDRFFPFPPPFIEGLNPDLHIACTIAIFLVYTLLRRLMRAVCTGRKADALAHNSAFFMFRTLFCIVPPFFLATAGLLTVFGIDETLIKNIVFAEIILSYLILFWRQREILIHYRSGLATILYLCGVEILPVCFVAALWLI
ncbi:MAG: hypothetical protein LUD72_07625 [Bacteroidales bacterium]|nr:hypothetical protein [Bacteroidales bacterium]